MTLLCAMAAGICVAGALIPASHPTPTMDAILWGLAAFNALAAIIQAHAT